MKLITGLFLVMVSFASSAGITHEELGNLIKIFHLEYDQELALKNERFFINQNPQDGEEIEMYWDFDVVRASYNGDVDKQSGATTHMIYMFGGYARLSYMTVDGIAMSLCHELGHGLATGPKKSIDSNDPTSYPAAVEGESDYFAAQSCIKRILPYLEDKKELADSDYAIDACMTQKDQSLCLRMFRELESDKAYFADKSIFEDNAQSTSFETHDATVVDHVETDPEFYPSAQCRLDTMMNGILNLERPACWYVQ